MMEREEENQQGVGDEDSVRVERVADRSVANDDQLVGNIDESLPDQSRRLRYGLGKLGSCRRWNVCNTV